MKTIGGGAAERTERQSNNRSRVHDSVNHPRLRSDPSTVSVDRRLISSLWVL
jgi:hypothetical protein